MLTILSLTCNIRYFSLIFTATVVKPYFLTFHGRRTLAAATGIAQKKKWGARKCGSTICLKHVNHGRLWVFFTRRHRLHVSASTNKEKAPWAIRLYYHANREPSFAIVLCTNMVVLRRDWRAPID